MSLKMTFLYYKMNLVHLQHHHLTMPHCSMYNCDLIDKKFEIELSCVDKKFEIDLNQSDS